MSLRVALSRFGLILRRIDRDRYRPERYYMRGAGPAWRAKNPDGSV